MEGEVIKKTMIKSENLGSYENLFPFLFLEPDELENLLVKGKCEQYTISNGFCINKLLEGKASSGLIEKANFGTLSGQQWNNLSCFFLYNGKIKCRKKNDSKNEASSNFKIESNNLYALDGPILGDHIFLYETLGEAEIIVIPREKILETVEKNKAFNYQVGIKILQKEGVLAPIIQLKNYLKHCTNEDEIKNEILLMLYKKVAPLNHPYCNDPNRIDFKSWVMAIKYLPEFLPYMTNVLLFLKLPEMFKNLTEIKSNNEPKNLSKNESKNDPRNREIYLFEQDKSYNPFLSNSENKFLGRKSDLYNYYKVQNSSKYFIFLRDFDTDLQEFIGYICIHLIESKKFIAKMREHETFSQFINECSTLSQLLEYFKRINLSEEEIKDFKEACFSHPSSEGNKLYFKSIVGFFSACFMQYGEITFKFKLPSSFIKPSNLNLLINKIGIELNGYPSKQVHLMICSRRCIGRLFDPNILKKGQEYFVQKKEKLEEDTEYLTNANLIDKYCYAYGIYLEENNSSHKPPFTQSKEGSGYYPMEINEKSDKHFYFTLINLEEINPDLIDPEVKKYINESNRNDLILCVNYFQGHLAIEAINNLCLLLGKRMKSFGFIGSADSINLRGQKKFQTKRVIIADKFIFDESSDIALANFNHLSESTNLNIQGLNEKALLTLTSSMNNHDNLNNNFETGSVLTAGERCMRNKNLYSVYSQLFQCKGVDGEGFYIARELKRMNDDAIIEEVKKISFVYTILNTHGENIYVKGNEKIYNCGHPIQNSVYRSVVNYLIS